MGRKDNLVVLGICVLLLLMTGTPVHAFTQGPQKHWAWERLHRWQLEQPEGGMGKEMGHPDRSVKSEEFTSLFAAVWGEDALKTTGFFGKMKEPEGCLTRQEAVSFLYRALFMDLLEYEDVLGKYKDTESLDPSVKEIWNAAVADGLLNGYPDRTLKPDRLISLAETLTLIDHAAGKCYSKAQRAGGDTDLQVWEGNVTLRTTGILLKNMKITGNLYITAGTGRGSIWLDHVTVLGRTVILGKAVDKVVIKNCALGKTALLAEDCRIHADASTMIGKVTVMVPVSLEKDKGRGVGIGNVLVALREKTDRLVELKGSFGNLRVESRDSRVTISDGNVDSLEVADSAEGTVLTLQRMQLEKMKLQAASEVKLKASSITWLYTDKDLENWSIDISSDSRIDKLYTSGNGKITGEGKINRTLPDEPDREEQ
jgi:hypothetical protein